MSVYEEHGSISDWLVQEIHAAIALGYSADEVQRRKAVLRAYDCLPLDATSIMAWQNDDITYRVSHDVDSGKYDVVCFGNPRTPNIEGRYKDWEELPEWVRDKISVLRIMDAPPPIREVRGVGARMGEELYWIYEV